MRKSIIQKLASNYSQLVILSSLMCDTFCKDQGRKTFWQRHCVTRLQTRLMTKQIACNVDFHNSFCLHLVTSVQHGSSFQLLSLRLELQLTYVYVYKHIFSVYFLKLGRIDCHGVFRKDIILIHSFQQLNQAQSCLSLEREPLLTLTHSSFPGGFLGIYCNINCGP